LSKIPDEFACSRRKSCIRSAWGALVWFLNAVRRLQQAGVLPQHKDRNGIYRFQPHDVAEVARKLKRVVRTDGETAGTIYGYFLAPEFRATPKQLARIVHETRQHPDVVLALWEKFKAGAGSPATADADIARVAREYDEQIAAMDEELARKRRVAFIPGDGSRSG
jgi:predicted nucleic acid-binding protein